MGKYIIISFFSGVLFFFVVINIFINTINLDTPIKLKNSSISIDDLSAITIKNNKGQLSVLDSLPKIKMLYFCYFMSREIKEELQSLVKLKNKFNPNLEIFIVSEKEWKHFKDDFRFIRRQNFYLNGVKYKDDDLSDMGNIYLFYENKLVFHTNQTSNWDNLHNIQFLENLSLQK